MLLTKTTSDRTRMLIVLVCFKGLMATAVLGLSVGAIAQHSKPQRQDFATFVSIPKAGPLCDRIVFDNNTSQIVSSAKVQCRSEGLAHEFQAPLASLRRGFTSR